MMDLPEITPERVSAYVESMPEDTVWDMGLCHGFLSLFLANQDVNYAFIEANKIHLYDGRTYDIPKWYRAFAGQYSFLKPGKVSASRRVLSFHLGLIVNKAQKEVGT